MEYQKYNTNNEYLYLSSMAIVYQHRRKDNNEVFYIGIGKTINRAYSYGRNPHWNQIADNVGYEIDILINGCSWNDACEIEKGLIKEYGRKDLGLGSLVNMTDGGDGASFPGEKNPMFGKRLPQSSIERGKQKQKGRIIIHKEEKQKSINKEDFDLYEKEGWIRGRSKESINKTGKSKSNIPRNEETKKKISYSLKGKPGGMRGKQYNKKICPYCNKVGGGSNMSRYHFNNCKNK
jgi:hypothetical protein